MPAYPPGAQAGVASFAEFGEEGRLANAGRPGEAQGGTFRGTVKHTLDRAAHEVKAALAPHEDRLKGTVA